MTTRRTLLKSGLLAAVPSLAADADSPIDLVDLFIGTGGHGHTTPAATLPFGAVQLGPDTYNAVWDACSGYHDRDRSLMGFSHTHLNGTGIGDLLDVLVMPCVGPVQRRPGPLDDPSQGWRAPLRRADEAASPGYYRVALRDRGVVCEFTTTLRAGLHRYCFADGAGHLMIDLRHGMQDNPATPTRVPWCELTIVGQDTLVGGRQVDQWAKGRQLWFAMKFSRPFDRFEVFEGDATSRSGEAARRTRRMRPANDARDGGGLLAALHWAQAGAEPLLVKCALSAVDAEGAMRNLEAELPGWDFDAVRASARSIWERELARLRFAAYDARHARMLATAHYHCLLAPTRFDDVDGRYRGMDDRIHRVAPGTANFTQFSVWDTYRSLHPLLRLLQPERVPDLCNSLIAMAEQSPEGVPVWPLQGRETGCMIGYHSAVVLAEAQAKGLEGIDWKRAWPLWRRRAMDDGYRGLGLYRKLGFIPSDLEEEATSKTLEYAYDDWALASLARAAGADADHEHLLARSRNVRNVFNAKLSFVRPRLANGRWAEPFDPRALGHSKRWHDFTESNAWQATFLPQHDLDRYAALFGGERGFLMKLDALFDASSEQLPGAPPDIAGLIGQYAHGNEPSHHVAYLHACAGQPWKTQARVRQIMTTLYSDQPDGLAGNEDCGQMSAWLLLSALGLYPVDPVSARYVFGSPLVRHAVLDVGGGRRLVIEAPGNGPDAVYVQSVQWNGRPYRRAWIDHASLARGGASFSRWARGPIRVSVRRARRDRLRRSEHPRRPQETSHAAPPASSTRVALTVVITMFFIWGFLTSLNDVLVPHLKSVFALNYAQSMLVQFTFFGAYFVMSLPSGALVSRLGYRNSIVLGLLISALGALLFLPAAKLPSYAVFLLAFFVLASGITLLQVAANAYVSLLGEPRLASSRLNLAQAFNSLGTTIAPALGGWLILRGAVEGSANDPVAQAQLVQGPYLGIAVILALAAVAVFAFQLPSIAYAEEGDAGSGQGHGFRDALAVGRMRHAIAAIFVYVGAEVTIGSFLINYLSQPTIGAMSELDAAHWVSLYWGGAMVGRFVGAAVLRHVQPRWVLGGAAALATALVALSMGAQGRVAVLAIVAVGLFNSVMFPTIFTLGIEGMGPLTGRASSLMIMAIVGGAVIPLLQGLVADRIGLQPSFVLPLLCYGYIVYYALRGSRDSKPAARLIEGMPT